MRSRYAVLGAVAIIAGITGAAVAPWRPSPVRAVSSGPAPLHIFGGRSAAQAASPHGAKYDAALASIARHLPQVRADQALADLRSLNPGMRFQQPPGTSEPLALIDAVTTGDPQALKAMLEGLGLQHSSVYSNDVGGWLPVSQLETATHQSVLHSIRAAMPKTRSGAVTTQGDFVIHADSVRSTNSLDGSGVTVGIISDSYNCYSQYAQAGSGVPASGPSGYASNGYTATASTDIGTGDLPASADINILNEANCFGFDKTLQLPMGDEGRAMMQIVHDVAPGAKLAFYTAENSEADFATGIQALANAGAKVIADDVGYFDEPVFQDGIVAQAIDAVAAAGVSYFSAAGNNGDTAYDDLAPDFSATAASGANAGEHLLTFNGGSGTSLPLTIPALSPGDFVAVVVEWDQPYITGAPASGGSTSAIDLCVNQASGGSNTIINDNGTRLSQGCTGASSVGQDAVQLILIGNPASNTTNSAPESVNIQVGVANGVNPGRIKVIVEGNGVNLTFAPTGPTMQGHPYAAGAAAVGAAYFVRTPACGDTTVEMDSYSSKGGDQLLFSASGTRLSAPMARAKPDFVGPDGGNDTFLGFNDSAANNATPAQCKNNTSYPNFFGTSAATPHLAAVAALLLQADPVLTPAQIRQFMIQSVIPTNQDASFSGAGFVQASTAATFVPAVLPAAPTLTLSADSVAVGGSVTLSWTSANTTGCTASGNWSGSEPSNGSLTISPTAAGSSTYALYCSNAAGNSTTTSLTLTITAASVSRADAGGAIDLWSLVGLSLLAAGAARTRRASLRR